MLLKRAMTHHLWLPPFAFVKLGVRGLWLAWQPTSLCSLPLKSPETLHLKSEIQLMSASQPYLFALNLSTYLLLPKVCKGPQLSKTPPSVPVLPHLSHKKGVQGKPQTPEATHGHWPPQAFPGPASHPAFTPYAPFFVW